MPNGWTVSLWIGIGGFAGSLCRYGLSLLFARWSPFWPTGTLAANVLGCFVIGAVMAAVERGGVFPPIVRMAVATGFCGGFTTLSSFMYETVQMVRAEEYLSAGVYVGGTLLLSAAGFLAGVALVRTLTGGAT